MAALNYFLGIKAGADMRMSQITAGTATVGTAADVEVRLQINDGSVAVPLTRKEVHLALERILAWIDDGGLNHAGAFLPPL